MTGPTRRRSQLRVAPATPSSASGSVNSPGSSPWAAGVGGLLRRTEGGRQGREVGVRADLDSVLTSQCLVFQMRPRRRHHPSSRRRPPGSSLRPGKLLLPGALSPRVAGVARLRKRKRLAARPLPHLPALPPAPPSSSSLRSLRAEPRIFSWCLLPPVARLGAPFALFVSLPYLLRRETRKGLRAPYLFSACKPSGLSCV